MNFKIDNLQYCNWSRKVFEINRDAGLDAVHVTIVYHEDFDELLIEINKWQKLFKENSDLIDESKNNITEILSELPTNFNSNGRIIASPLAKKLEKI